MYQYNQREILPDDIIDFYLTQSPHASSDKASSVQSINLEYYNWKKSGLHILMKWIATHSIAADAQSYFKFTISKDVCLELHSSVDPGVSGMKLLEHNAGLFCINWRFWTNKAKQIKCVLIETYATCFFRHLRNSIAHGNYWYDSKRGVVLFLDQKEAGVNSNLTAYFQVDIAVLRELIGVIKNGPTCIDQQVYHDYPQYRIDHKLEVDIEEYESYKNS